MDPIALIALIGVASLVVERSFSYFYALRKYKSSCCEKEIIAIEQTEQHKHR